MGDTAHATSPACCVGVGKKSVYAVKLTAYTLCQVRRERADGAPSTPTLKTRTINVRVRS